MPILKKLYRFFAVNTCIADVNCIVYEAFDSTQIRWFEYSYGDVVLFGHILSDSLTPRPGKNQAWNFKSQNKIPRIISGDFLLSSILHLKRICRFGTTNSNYNFILLQQSLLARHPTRIDAVLIRRIFTAAGHSRNHHR